MPDPSDAPATILLQAAASGDKSAIDRLLPLVYDQLRAAAQHQLASERPGTLQATAIVHEAYLKLVGPRDIPWANRAHFYAAAAQAIRQILIDHARTRDRQKRGGGAARVPLEDHQLPGPDSLSTDPERILALDAALRRLEQRDPRMAQVVFLRFYAGLDIAQVAGVLALSERTVKSEWAFAKAWLEREFAPRDPDHREQQ